MIALDFETTGLHMHLPGESVKSAAFAWRENGEVRTRFVDSPASIRADLAHLARTQAPVCVYNVGFEGLVLLCKFPGLRLNIAADVMRLVQVYANDDSVQSFGLKASAPRILGDERGAWDKPINDWLKANGHKPADFHAAPRHLLREYNVGDAVATLELYEKITAEFAQAGYNWRFDHDLYMHSADLIVRSKARGMRVDRGGLARYVAAIGDELTGNEAEFLERYAAPVAEAEGLLTAKEQAKFKRKVVDRVPLNVDSNTHREVLFCRVMGIQPKFRTEGGAPSFKAKHLGTYGEAGAMLSERKSRQIVLTQAENLLALSEATGRWHSDLKLAGTATGRYAGGNTG